MKIVNLRDLGGIQNKSGQSIHSGLVFRTGNLSHIDESTADQIAQNSSAKYYIDFRAKDEIERFGKPQAIIDRGIKWINLEIDSMDPEFYALSHPNPDDWAKLYHKLFDRNVSKWKEFLSIIAETKEPLMYGCLFGKDRTGIATALLLETLEVDDHLIAKNFAETTQNIDGLFKQFSLLWKAHNLSEDEIFSHFMTAHPEAIGSFIEYVRRSTLADEAHEFTTHLSGKLKSQLKTRLLK